jgi:hypothetical protein
MAFFLVREYPYMTFPNDETGQVLAEMKEAGIDLTIEHCVVYFHLFEQKEQAQSMVDHITKNFPGVATSLHPDETPNVWDVDCSVTMTPSYDAITKQEAVLEKIATQFSGYNDGWGIEA